MKKDLNKIIEYTSKIEVLFIEDNEDVRNQLIKLLKNFFANIDVASDGLEAYNIYMENENRYKLIITDISMPKLDGIEFCRRIKVINPNQKILVISAHTENDKLNKLRDIGVKNILQKPVGHITLIESFEDLFELAN